MIGTVDCNVQAKYPSMPLDPMQAYVGSPSSIRVRNVPKRIGDWCIRSVQFAAVYPDASIKTAECKLVGGVWVGTIEGTQTSGKVQNGYSIFAGGTDENGNEVSGYCLGKGDVEILKADGTIDPDAPAFYVKLLEEPSEDPKPGQMWFNGDELNIVDENGDVKTYEQPELSGYATKDELSAKQDNISASGILSGDGQGNITSADMSMYVTQDAIHYNITTKTPILTESDTVATFNFDANTVNNIHLKSAGNDTLYVTSAYFYFPQSIVDKVRDFIVDVNLDNAGELKYYCYGNQLPGGANEQMTLYTDDGTLPVISAEGIYSFSFTEIEQQTQNDEVVASKWLMSVKLLSAVGGV